LDGDNPKSYLIYIYYDLTTITDSSRQAYFAKNIDDLLVVVYKQTIKSAQIRLHPQRPHTITKMNDNINMDNTIDESTNARSYLTTVIKPVIS
jgi:hypothetical protein